MPNDVVFYGLEKCRRKFGLLEIWVFKGRCEETSKELGEEVRNEGNGVEERNGHVVCGG